MGIKKTKILVGISGGVDSAVCAHKLVSEGYEVTGAMMKVYNGECKTIANSCYGADKSREIEDAKKICKKIGIEFNLIDCSKEFDKIVFDVFKNEYKSGRTPNPCILCNPYIKFGVFPELAKQAGLKFDKFATGHYAKIEYNKNFDKYLLKKGANAKKDQSYFLYRLTQDKLKNILFPLGNMSKDEVRTYAKDNELIVYDKSDSQDFYSGDYSQIIDAQTKKGKIVHITGKVLGEHNGIHNFTIGQRKGIKIAYEKPLYVINFNVQKNEVIVGEKEYTFSNTLYASNPSWTYMDTLVDEIKAQAKIRSRGNFADCIVKPYNNGIKVDFIEPQSSIAPGQSIVLYDKDTVLGGAVIDKFI